MGWGENRWLKAVALLLLLGCCVVARGDDKEFEEVLRAPLGGLEAVHVVVEKLPEARRIGGLSEQAVRDVVELRLRKHGIRLLTRQQSMESLGAPYLYVHLSFLPPSVELPEVPMAYALEVEFHQRVSLVRNPQITTYASTWSAPSVIGTVGVTNVRDVLGGLEEAVDHFANEFLAANQR